MGISTETASKLEEFDRNNVFWTTPDGVGGLSNALSPVYNPSLLRVGAGFVAPSDNSLVVFDGGLKVKAQLPVEDLGVGTSAGSDNSPDGQYGLFAFYDGDSQADEPDARLIVLASENAAQSIRSPHLVQALTACDDGTARWIEYQPNSNSDPLGPGRAYLASWAPGGSITSARIDADFKVAPSAESSLSCEKSTSYVDSPDRMGERSVVQISESQDGKLITDSIRKLPPFPTADGSRFTHTDGSLLYTLSADGQLSKVDYERGEVIYSETLSISGPGTMSATFEGKSAYLVTRPDEVGNRQSVQRVSLDDPSCTSLPVSLQGFDLLSEESKDERGEASYMAVQTVFPVHRQFEQQCEIK